MQDAVAEKAESPDCSTQRITAIETTYLERRRVEMTIRLETRELARCLLIYESELDDSSEPGASPTLHVYEKLRRTLCIFAGAAGFYSIASRALALVRSEDPRLSAARITEDGTLEGLDLVQHQTDFDKGVGGDPAGEAGVALIARLLELLQIFLGEALTANLLRVTWPGTALDECDSEKGRKA
ncbi:MAG: hypothetical protein ABR957_05570 [Terracidiphilus sp.]|jgi:hypothetical protein